MPDLIPTASTAPAVPGCAEHLVDRLTSWPRLTGWPQLLPCPTQPVTRTIRGRHVRLRLAAHSRAAEWIGDPFGLTPCWQWAAAGQPQSPHPACSGRRQPWRSRRRCRSAAGTPRRSMGPSQCLLLSWLRLSTAAFADRPKRHAILRSVDAPMKKILRLSKFRNRLAIMMDWWGD